MVVSDLLDAEIAVQGLVEVVQVTDCGSKVLFDGEGEDLYGYDGEPWFSEWDITFLFVNPGTSTLTIEVTD